MGAQHTSGLYGTDINGKPVGPIGAGKPLPSDTDATYWLLSNTANLPDNGNTGIYSNICTYDQFEGYSSSGFGGCKIGNALPIISGLANGQTTYTMPITSGVGPSSKNVAYSYPYLPSPCSGTLPTPSFQNTASDLDYHQPNNTYADDVQLFPIGSPTKSFEGGSLKDAQSVSGQQGYYLHGIYSCVLDEDYPDPVD